MLSWNKLIDQTLFFEIIDGDVCHLDTIIALFDEQARENLQAMDVALENCDIQAFERTAHDLKNLGRNIAAQSLISLSEELESLARQACFKEAQKHLSKTRGVIKRAGEELRYLRDKWAES